jgi:hypothetical protein
LVCPDADGIQEVLQTGLAGQVETELALTDAGQVRVGICKPRVHDRATQIDHFGGLAPVALDVGPIADTEDAAAGDGDSLCLRALLIQRMHHGVDKDPVRHRPLRLAGDEHEQGKKGKAKAFHRATSGIVTAGRILSLPQMSAGFSPCGTIAAQDPVASHPSRNPR